MYAIASVLKLVALKEKKYDSSVVYLYRYNHTRPQGMMLRKTDFGINRCFTLCLSGQRLVCFFPILAQISPTVYKAKPNRGTYCLNVKELKWLAFSVQGAKYKFNPETPKRAKNQTLRKISISFCKVLVNKWYHANELPKRFHLSAHTVGFHRQTKKLEQHYMSYFYNWLSE